MATDSYDDLVLSHKPAMYLPMASAASGTETDLTGRGHTGTYHPSADPSGTSELPNGARAAVFNGTTQYLQVADASDLSVTSRRRLTIEAWIRPDTLQFPAQEGSGYVHFLGKGEPNQHEYAARMYSLTNDEDRPNRISGYAFNLSGGFGSGSFFQDPVTAGAWILVAIVINTFETSAAHPTGYVRIFKNGALRDTTGLDQFNVTPSNGTAPFRVGTRDGRSFFQGAIGKVAVYLRELTPDQLGSHYTTMRKGGYC
jgi:Concanavalin A-like lectin/glucanases superfamily